eukprot:scaffold19235_cov126-Isochrysis_galbana.AAC.25
MRAAEGLREPSGAETRKSGCRMPSTAEPMRTPQTRGSRGVGPPSPSPPQPIAPPGRVCLAQASRTTPETRKTGGRRS